MTSPNTRERALLFLGDLVAFFFSLWLALAIRYREIPTDENISIHLVPFSILFLIWVVVFFIAGLYEKHTLILKNRIGNTILNSQLVASFLSVLFFYLIPYFGITPKTNLFIFLIISLFLIYLWRQYVFPVFEVVEKQNAILIATGEEMAELEREVNNNSRYDMKFISSVDIEELDSLDFKEEILNRVYSEKVGVVAVDFRNEKVEPLLPSLYNLIFSNVRFIDMHRIYEDIFDRIPLSLVKYSWFLEHISGVAQKSYDILKRLMDLVLSLALGLVSLIVYPFVIAAIKINDGGPIFFTQERVGKNNKPIKIIKFRSLSVHNDPGGIAKNPEPTGVGKFLRKSRIDELPQLWNVFKGDLSLIGPRPEIPDLVKVYEKEISYYNIRHLIKPGLSGWAQLYHKDPPKFAAQINETKKKLSYDLFYIKNRSLGLDLKIALRTIKILLSREGI